MINAFAIIHNKKYICLYDVSSKRFILNTVYYRPIFTHTQAEAIKAEYPDDEELKLELAGYKNLCYLCYCETVPLLGTELREGIASIDDNFSFPCWVDPTDDKWNGWDVPLFELPAVKQIAEKLNAQEDNTRAWIDDSEGEPVLVIAEEDMTADDYLRFTPFAYRGHAEKLYAVGDYYWTWTARTYLTDAEKAAFLVNSLICPACGYENYEHVTILHANICTLRFFCPRCTSNWVTHYTASAVDNTDKYVTEA